DQMHMHLRDQMADDRQVEGLRHAGDFQPLRDAADPYQIYHRDIDRARLQHVAERHNAPDIFAAGDRGRQRVADPRQPGELVGRRHVLEPEQADPGILDATADIDRLLWPPALVDVAHQLDVGTDRLADLDHALDLNGGRGLARQRELR